MKFPTLRNKAPRDDAFEMQLRKQRDTELATMNEIREAMFERGMDTYFLVSAIQKLGVQPIAEDRSLQEILGEYTQTVEASLRPRVDEQGASEPKLDPEDAAELNKNLVILRAINAAASLKVSLELLGTSNDAEKKTALKEMAQMSIYKDSDSLTDGEFDLLIDYTEHITPGVTGVDFTDAASIAAAESVYDHVSKKAIPSS